MWMRKARVLATNDSPFDVLEDQTDSPPNLKVIEESLSVATPAKPKLQETVSALKMDGSRSYEHVMDRLNRSRKGESDPAEVR